MNTSPIVTDQLHTQKNTEVPVLKPRVWASVDLPTLSLSDPVGTTTNMPIAPKAPAQPLKKSDPVSTIESSLQGPKVLLDSALEARIAQLRAKTLALRDEADDVRRKTGKLT